tara:strand:+ start:903 stop:1562 length:660 start_codon:yes stop_codon:yes gene_type:complete
MSDIYYSKYLQSTGASLNSKIIKIRSGDKVMTFNREQSIALELKVNKHKGYTDIGDFLFYNFNGGKPQELEKEVNEDVFYFLKELNDGVPSIEGENLSVRDGSSVPKIFFNRGPAAAIAKLMIEEPPTMIAHLTLDWSYDGIYFQIFDEGNWTKTITLSTGPKTVRNDIDVLLNLPSLDISNFKRLSFEISNRMKSNFLSESEIGKSLAELERITDLFV